MKPTAYISGALMNTVDIHAARARYEAFGAACERAGWDAYVPHQHADPVRDPAMANRAVAEKDLKAIAVSDVIVADVSEPSLGVGLEIALAIEQGRRVLLVAAVGAKVSRFALGYVEVKRGAGVIHRYASVDDACAWIERQLA